MIEDKKLLSPKVEKAKIDLMGIDGRNKKIKLLSPIRLVSLTKLDDDPSALSGDQSVCIQTRNE